MNESDRVRREHEAHPAHDVATVWQQRLEERIASAVDILDRHPHAVAAARQHLFEGLLIQRAARDHAQRTGTPAAFGGAERFASGAVYVVVGFGDRSTHYFYHSPTDVLEILSGEWSAAESELAERLEAAELEAARRAFTMWSGGAEG